MNGTTLPGRHHVLGPGEMSFTAQSRYGLGLWAFVVYANALLESACGGRSSPCRVATPRSGWRSVTLLLLLVTVPLLLHNARMLFGLTLVSGVDTTPLIFGLIAPAFTLILPRCRHKDIVPVARGRVIDQCATRSLCSTTPSASWT